MRRLLILACTFALATAACGGQDSSGGNARQTLDSALDNLTNSEGVSVTISLQSTTESLQALAADGGDRLSAEDAQKILDSSLRIAGTQPEDPAEGSSEMVVNIAGEDLVELRTIATDLYVRADVRALVDLSGGDRASLEAMLGQAPGAGLEFLRPLVEGEWLRVEGLEQLTGQAASEPTEQQRRAIDGLVEALRQDTSVSSEGDEDPGTHLVASISLRDAYRSLQEAAQGLGGAMAPGGPLPAESGLPDEDAFIDLWVRDGRLTQAEFDFLQAKDLGEGIIPAGVERLVLRMTFEDFSGEVTAPEGAVPVDLNQVMQGFLGAASGAQGASAPTPAGGGGTGPSELCAQLEGQPREVREQFADQCPDLVEG